MSTGNTKKQITMMRDFGVTAIACTPSYLLHNRILRREQFMKDELKYAILGGEPWTDNMRKEIEKRLGIKAYNIYGMSEIIGQVYLQIASTTRTTYMRIILFRDN